MRLDVLLQLVDDALESSHDAVRGNLTRAMLTHCLEDEAAEKSRAALLERAEERLTAIGEALHLRSGWSDDEAIDEIHALRRSSGLDQ